jgi:hypothetical protein
VVCADVRWGRFARYLGLRRAFGLPVVVAVLAFCCTLIGMSSTYRIESERLLRPFLIGGTHGDELKSVARVVN